MATFEIEQYELHVMKYRVKAENEAEAIRKVLVGEAESVNGTLEFVEVAEDFGLPVDEKSELADELRSLGIPVDEHVIPSIRNVQPFEYSLVPTTSSLSQKSKSRKSRRNTWEADTPPSSITGLRGIFFLF